MHKIAPSAYKATIFSKTLKRDVDFWIEDDFILPELSRSECLAEEDVCDEIKKHYDNLGE